MIRLKLDENFNPGMTELFRDAGFDAHSVLEESLSGAPDETMLYRPIAPFHFLPYD